MNNINVHNSLIQIVKDQSLAIDDCRLFARKISDNLNSSIFDLFKADIKENQSKRQHKNNVRNQQRANEREKRDVDKANTISNLIKSTSPTANLSGIVADESAINMSSASDAMTADGTRQY